MGSANVTYAEIASRLDADVARFLDCSKEEVLERCAAAREERAFRWIEAHPRSEDERRALRSSLGELELLVEVARHREDEEAMELHDRMVSVAQEAGGRVLDCAGGIGDTALVFAANGLEVTYVDEPGVCSDFARQRWEWFGFADRMHAITPGEFWERPAGEFSLVASLDVLQGLEAPQRHAARYRELLKPGGHLFVTADFERGPDHPEHLPENEGFHRLFGGEAKTARRSVLTNLGFHRNRWFWYVRA